MCSVNMKVWSFLLVARVMCIIIKIICSAISTVVAMRPNCFIFLSSCSWFCCLLFSSNSIPLLISFAYLLILILQSIAFAIPFSALAFFSVFSSCWTEMWLRRGVVRILEKGADQPMWVVCLGMGLGACSPRKILKFTTFETVSVGFWDYYWIRVLS